MLEVVIVYTYMICKDNLYIHIQIFLQVGIPTNKESSHRFAIQGLKKRAGPDLTGFQNPPN